MRHQNIHIRESINAYLLSAMNRCTPSTILQPPGGARSASPIWFAHVSRCAPSHGFDHFPAS